MNPWLGCYPDCPCQVCLQNLQGQTETGLGQVEERHCFHCSEKRLLRGHWMWWDGHLAGGAGAGVGDGAGGAAAAAPPCLITRWTVIPSWNITMRYCQACLACTFTLWEESDSWSFIILPAKMRQRFSTGAPENFAEMASLNWGTHIIDEGKKRRKIWAMGVMMHKFVAMPWILFWNYERAAVVSSERKLSWTIIDCQPR